MDFCFDYDSWITNEDNFRIFSDEQEEDDEEYLVRVEAENKCPCEMPGICELCSRDEKYYKYCYESKKLVRMM